MPRATLRLLLLAGIATGCLPASLNASAQPTLTEVARFGHQLTGVNVTKDGRIFLNFPRWTEDNAISVAELKNGKAVTYPDNEWNSWRNAKNDKISPKDHFVCVQSIVVDHADNLWVLDPGAPALSFRVPGAPKLVKINTSTNKVERVLAFGDDIAPQGSYLNDVRFSPDDKWAYMTDSGAIGALVVIDLTSGKGKRVLAGDPSTQADKSVEVTYDGKVLRKPDGEGVAFTADGLALSSDGKIVYWQAIKGKTLYSLPAADLQRAFTDPSAEASMPGKITVVGEDGPADGLLISRHDGKMYVTGPETNSIRVRDLSKPGSKLSTVVQDKRLVWPDTFAEGPDGTIYVSASHIPESAMFKPSAPAALPTELWSFKPE